MKRVRGGWTAAGHKLVGVAPRRADRYTWATGCDQREDPRNALRLHDITPRSGDPGDMPEEDDGERIAAPRVCLERVPPGPGLFVGELVAVDGGGQ